VLRNEAEVANSEQMLADSEREYGISLIELKTLMGVHLESRLEPTDAPSFRAATDVVQELIAGTGPGTAPPPQGNEGSEASLAALLLTAEKRRPELAAAGFRVEAGRHELSVARSAFKPQVSAGVMGDLMKMKGESAFTGSTFALTASFPILDGGLRRANVRMAKAEQERAALERIRIALQVGQEVATALASLRTAERNVTTAKTAVAAAEEDYRVALLRYTSGLGINVEALDALATQVRAQSNQIRAVYEFNVAQDRLARAVGKTPGVKEANGHGDDLGGECGAVPGAARGEPRHGNGR
jgi:outer membrane protein TolC